MQMRAYAVEQATALLGHLAFRVGPAVKRADPDSIHELRVAIRRFARCLRAFGQFFPGRESKKIRQRLRRIMDLSAEVRDRDVALDLCKKAGLPSDAPVLARLKQERQLTQQKLATKLVRLRTRDFSRRWRKRLKL